MASNDNTDLDQNYIGNNTDTNTSSSSNTNQRFVTRVFHEQDNQVIGAEVIVYDDDQNIIDSIVIADKTSLEEFQRKWEEISQYYVLRGDVVLPEDMQDNTTLNDILANVDGDVDINATTLNGAYTFENFSLSDHTHNDLYCSKKHSSDNQDYGIGTNSLFGHVKVVDNLNDSTFKDATALSSHQGYELNKKIENVNARFQWSSTQKLGDYMKYRVNPDLRLIVMNYNRAEYTGCKKTTGKHILHKAGAIPSYYVPTSRVITPLFRGDLVLYYNTDGSVVINNLTKFDSIGIHAQVMWHY